jgi:hypothetical protein
MKRIVLCFLFVVTIGVAHAAPARLGYTPLPSPQIPSPSIDFRGTRWFGKTYEGADWTIIFELTGRVTNIENGMTYTVGSWKSTGPMSVYMELNNNYYEYRGIVTGDILAGDSSNINGLRWKTNFKRMP